MPEPITVGRYDRLTTAGYTLERGWSDELAAQLVANSRQSEILRHTPRDAAERFSDEEAAHAWYESNHPTVYALARTAALAGVIWFSHRPRTEFDADYTFAIRMYDMARGKGLAKPFVTASEADFRKKHEPRAIWLETDMENSAARNLYRSIGYKVIAANSARITMRR
jgi:ribosomal protein S18 acetylase RimI-like enzyme